MFQSYISVILGDPHVTTHGSVQTCSLRNPWPLPGPCPSSDLLKLVHLGPPVSSQDLFELFSWECLIM